MIVLINYLLISQRKIVGHIFALQKSMMLLLLFFSRPDIHKYHMVVKQTLLRDWRKRILRDDYIPSMKGASKVFEI